MGKPKITVKREDSGIFQTVTRHEHADASDPEAMKAVIERSAEAWSRHKPEDDLEWIERVAKRIIDTPRPRNAEKAADHARAQKDAKDALLELGCLRALLEKRDFHNAVWVALELGYLSMKMVMRIHEWKVRQVKRITASLAAGAPAPKYSPEDRQKAVALYDRLLAAMPKPKKATVEKRVKDELGVSPRTLRTWLHERP